MGEQSTTQDRDPRLASQSPADAPDGGAGPAGSGIVRLARRRRFGAFVERYALVGVWAIVVLVFSLALPDTYATSENIQTIFGSQAVLLVLTLGLIVALTANEFDLSVAAVLVLSSMIVAKLNVGEGWPIVPAIAAAIAASVVVGVVNGAIVIGLRVSAFIVTLGTGTVLSGIVDWMSGSQTISGVSTALTDWTITKRFLGVSLVFWFGLVLCVVFWYLYQLTPLGRRLLFVGRNRDVARLSGLRVERLRLGALVTSATVAGVAGVLYVGALGGADPSSGDAFLLPAFAAAYLGATTIAPGRFNPVGTFVAVYFLVSGITGLQLLGAQDYVQELFYGGALVLAVALSAIVARRRARADGSTTG